MNYDAMQEREETLKAYRRRERKTWTFVISFLVLIYVGISIGAYHSKHPELSPVDVVVEHFFDAVFWNHDTEKSTE